MIRNKKLKKTARGNWYWKSFNNISFVNGIVEIPNTPVNKDFINFMRNHPMNEDHKITHEFIGFPDGYRCQSCGNEISLEESQYGDAILCTRCPSGEYTQMEPFNLEF